MIDFSEADRRAEEQDEYPGYLGLRPDDELACVVGYAEDLPDDRRALFHQLLNEIDQLVIADLHPEQAAGASEPQREHSSAA